MANCLNCNAELTGAYCAQCGQKNIRSGLRFGEVISDFFSYNFSIDGPILQTLKLLVMNPGELYRSFIQGKRKSYYKPIQFFIVTTLVYFAFGEIIGYDPLKDEFGDEAPSSMEETMAFVERTVRWMVGNLNNLLFLMAFGIALILKIFHWKRQTLAEFLVIGFYIAGFYILVGMIDPILSIVGVRFEAVKILFFFAYFAYAYASYLERSGFLTILKGLLLGAASWMFYFVSSFGLSALVVYVFDL